jgi:hypothetical protein
VQFIGEYYEGFNALPSPKIIEAEGGVGLEIQQITRDEIEYCSKEIEKFCKHKALQSAIVKASAEIAKGDGSGDFDYEQLVRDAMLISLSRDIGIDYFDDPEARIRDHAENKQRVSTGWDDVDDALGGGLARGETALFCANSGSGKSVTLNNLAMNFCAQGYHVLCLSLELSEALIAQRFDIMYTGIPSVMHKVKMDELSEAIAKISHQQQNGSITIKWMPSDTNAIQMRGYIKEYELKNGYVPDMLIVDYLDLMGTNNKVSSENIWAKDKAATEQLGDILKFYDMFGATASQLNRSAIEAEELNQGHTAGGISKVNTVDWQIAILHNPAMKAQGEIMFQFLKARSSDAVGRKIFLKWDNTFLRILNNDKKRGDDAFSKAIKDKTTSGLPDRGGKLTDIFSFDPDKT